MTFDDLKTGGSGVNFLNEDFDDDDKSEDDHMADFSSHDEENSNDNEHLAGEDDGGDGRDTIERLKDDLFADEEEPQSGLYLSHLSYSLR
jgi:U3 small nucleolar RNA-associated protein MPP10